MRRETSISLSVALVLVLEHTDPSAKKSYLCISACSSVHGLVSPKCFLALCSCKASCQREGLRCLPGMKGYLTAENSENIQLCLWHLGSEGGVHREMPGHGSHSHQQGCIGNPVCVTTLWHPIRCPWHCKCCMKQRRKGLWWISQVRHTHQTITKEAGRGIRNTAHVEHSDPF